MNAEKDLYEFLGSLEFDRLPAETVTAAQSLVLDHLGCAFLGARMPWARAVRRVTAAGAYDGPHAAIVYGDETPVFAPTAALVNGTAGHSLDLDDLYFPTMSHPGCVVVPAAIAAALATGADGRALLTGVVAGYEVMGRIGLATGLRPGERGFHATGVHGPAGAAAAVAMLGKHDAASVESAVGVAGSLGAGIKAFTNGPGMVKRLHAGRAAEAGVLAGLLVADDFTGPVTPLAGQFGLVHVLAGDDADPGALSRRLGERYVVDDVYLKPYAACGALHGAVRAADELAAEVDPAHIERVVVGTSQRALDQNHDVEPADAMSVQYSTECCVALALLGFAHDPLRAMTVGERPDDPARVLARRVTLELDARAEEAYPDPNMSRVDVVLTDGRTLSRYGSCDRTTSRGWDTAVSKFNGVTGEVLDDDARDATVAAVRTLADGARVSNCVVPAGASRVWR